MDRSDRDSGSSSSDGHASTSKKKHPDQTKAFAKPVTAESSSKYDLFTLISSCHKSGIPIAGIIFFPKITSQTEGIPVSNRDDSSQKFALGEGATSEVMQYVIREQEKNTLLPPQTTVALKVFRLRTQPDQLGYMETRRNILRTILREINIYSHPRLSRHPNLVRLLFVGWWPENAFPALAMELSSYGSLDDVIKASHKRLSILQMRHITIDIAMGLFAIHSIGFLHGDLKPDNILLMIHKDPARGIIAKITDFGGSAKMTGRNVKPAFFTRLWAAPEVENQDLHVDWKKADVYSYGLVVGSLWAGNEVPFFDHIRHKRSSCFLSRAIDPKLKGSEDDFLFLLKSQNDGLFNLCNFLQLTSMAPAIQEEIVEFVKGPLQGHFWLRPSMEQLIARLTSFASSADRNIFEEIVTTYAQDDVNSKAQKNGLYRNNARSTLMDANGMFLQHKGFISEYKSFMHDDRYIDDMPIQLAVSLSDSDFLHELLRQLQNTMPILKEFVEPPDFSEFLHKGKSYKIIAVSMLYEVIKSKKWKSTTFCESKEEPLPSFNPSSTDINAEMIQNLRLAALHGQCIGFATLVMAGKHKEGEFPVRLFLSLLALYRSAWAMQILSVRWPSYVKIIRRILRYRCLDWKEGRDKETSPDIRSLKACLIAHIMPRQTPIPPLTLNQTLSLGAVEDIKRILEKEHTADVQSALPTLLHRLAELTDDEAVSLARLAYGAGASLDKLYQLVPAITCDGIYDISPEVGLVSPLSKAIHHGNVRFALELLRIHVEFQKPITDFKSAFRISIICRHHTINRELLQLVQTHPALLQDAGNQWKPTAEFFDDMLSIAVCLEEFSDSRYMRFAFHGENYAKAYGETLDLLFAEFAKYSADGTLSKNLIEVALKSDNLIAVVAYVEALRKMKSNIRAHLHNITAARPNLAFHAPFRVKTAFAACLTHKSERCFNYLVSEFPYFVDMEAVSLACYRPGFRDKYLRSILEARPDIMAADDMNNVPLLEALRQGNHAAAKIIAEFCSPPRLRQLLCPEPAEGKRSIFSSILWTWREARSTKLIDSIRWLIENKAVPVGGSIPCWAYILPSKPRFCGRTHQLLDAELLGVLLDVEELYEVANTTTFRTWTIFHAAVLKGHLEVVKLLIDKKVKLRPGIYEGNTLTALDLVFHMFLYDEIPEEIQQGGGLESRRWLDNLQAISLLLIDYGCISTRFDNLSKTKLRRFTQFKFRQMIRGGASRMSSYPADMLLLFPPEARTEEARASLPIASQRKLWHGFVLALHEEIKRRLPEIPAEEVDPEYFDPFAISDDDDDDDEGGDCGDHDDEQGNGDGNGDDNGDDNGDGNGDRNPTTWKEITGSPESLEKFKGFLRYRRLEWRLPPNWTIERIPEELSHHFPDSKYIYMHHMGEEIDFSPEKPPLYCGEDATCGDTRNEAGDDTSDARTSEAIISDAMRDVMCDEVHHALCDTIRNAIREIKRPFIDRTPHRPEQYETDTGIKIPQFAFFNFLRDMDQKMGQHSNRNLDDGFRLGPDCPPLHSSLAQSDDYEAVEVLLQNGADLNQVYSRHTPMSLAVTRGRIACLDRLIHAGAKANSVADPDTQTTSLHLAARHGHWSVAMALHAAGADINAKDIKSRTPIVEAVEAKQWFMIEPLIEMGADVSAIKGHIGPDGEFLPRPEGM